MKVKIGDKVYNSEEEPVMVILSKEEKEQIVQMSPYCSKYCVYPVTEEFTKNDYAGIKKWMNDA